MSCYPWHMIGKTLVRLTWAVVGGYVGFHLLWGDWTSTSRAMKTQRMLHELVLAAAKYRGAYGHNPVPPALAAPGSLRHLETAGTPMALLVGMNVEGLNPARTIFFDPAPKGRTRQRLKNSGSASAIRFEDVWGHPYILILSPEDDRPVANPDLKNASAAIRENAPATVGVVAAYSSGPDGVEGTEDDLVSWRPTPPGSRPPSLALLLDDALQILAAALLFAALCNLGLLLWQLGTWIRRRAAHRR